MPQKLEAERKTRVLQMRVNTSQLATIQAAADLYGMNKSRFIRDVVLPEAARIGAKQRARARR